MYECRKCGAPVVAQFYGGRDSSWPFQPSPLNVALHCPRCRSWLLDKYDIEDADSPKTAEDRQRYVNIAAQKAVEAGEPFLRKSEHEDDKPPLGTTKDLIREVILALEWSSFRRGPVIDEDSPMIPACPSCLGIKTDDSMGEANFQPEAIGHTRDCRLKMAIDIVK